MRTYKQFTVGSLIEWCEAHESDVLDGVSEQVGSWRGDYYEVAIEPGDGVTGRSLGSVLRARLGTKMTGYKGGEFEISAYCDVYLAEWGSIGGALGVSETGELAVME